jgi:hypothetical protein
MSPIIFFSIYVVLPVAPDPDFHSDFNRNEYHKQINNVAGDFDSGLQEVTMIHCSEGMHMTA